MQAAQSGVTTYHINEKGQAPQVYTDAGKAGDAWQKAALAPTSNVIMKTPDGRAKLYAAAGTEKGQVYKDLPFDNMPGASEFKQSFKESMERSKAELSMPTSHADMPALQMPELGKQYTGKFIDVKGTRVMQAVTDGNKIVFIEHNRHNLQVNHSELMRPGKEVTVRYPFSANVGIVREGLEKSMRAHEHAPKAFGGMSR